MATHPALLAMDYFGPVISAVLFVLIMSFVPEPTRLRFNAILAAGAVGAYLNGGFGVWELLYPALATPVVYRGLRSHRYIGLAWLMHAAWDFPHHLWGKSDLAFHANILVRLHDLRYPDRRLVPRRSTVAHSRPIISFATTCGTVDAPGAHRSIPAMRRVRQCLLNDCPWSVPLAAPREPCLT